MTVYSSPSVVISTLCSFPTSLDALCMVTHHRPSPPLRSCVIFPHRRSDELVCVLTVRRSHVIDFSSAPFFLFCAPVNTFVQRSLHFESLSQESITWAKAHGHFLAEKHSAKHWADPWWWFTLPPAKRATLPPPSPTCSLRLPACLTDSADLYHIFWRDDYLVPILECRSLKWKVLQDWNIT